ncbi:MAG: hypothetical protein M3O30_09440 [Planctomycetota bacterium]|nr:hypothetical protein [Planctomycetota bacterium]
MPKVEDSSKSAAPASKWRKPWWSRFPWRGAVLIAVGAFVVCFPVYTFFDETRNGGIHRKGDLLVVDLKAMSSFDMDQDTGTTADIPKIYRDLDGKRVLLTGQMYDPYSADGKVRNFTLVYSITQCCFNGPPKVQHLVEASLLPDRAADYYPDLVNVTGTLHVGVQTREGHVLSVYRIDVERVDKG